jgi:hypothetical protein
MFWLYVPFYERYLTLAIPPLALLAGRAATDLRRVVWGSAWAGAGLVYLVSLPGILAANLHDATADWLASQPRELRAARDLAARTDPNEFVATDYQLLAFIAGRPVAPPLVDTSTARVSSGWLTRNETLRALQDYQVSTLLWWWDDRFGKVEGLENAVEDRYDVAERYDATDSIDKSLLVLDSDDD